MCYVGKATKIFIFIVAVIVVTGLVVGLGLLSRNINPKPRYCSGENCYGTDYLPPPPLQFPFPSVPDSNAPNPPDSTVTSTTSPPLNNQSPPLFNNKPPPPPSVKHKPPSPPSDNNQSPSPPSLNIQSPSSPSVNIQSPPPPSAVPVSVVTPPAAVTAAPPRAVPVAPPPMNIP